MKKKEISEYVDLCIKSEYQTTAQYSQKTILDFIENCHFHIWNFDLYINITTAAMAKKI